MAKFNGHKNWNHWNVSLWINNDEALYLMARDYVKINTRQNAAERMLDTLHDLGIYKTQTVHLIVLAVFVLLWSACELKS